MWRYLKALLHQPKKTNKPTRNYWYLRTARRGKNQAALQSLFVHIKSTLSRFLSVVRHKFSRFMTTRCKEERCGETAIDRLLG